MFTGLVESTGMVISPAGSGSGSESGVRSRLVLEARGIATELGAGDSLAVNGCCLTATDIDAEKGTVGFDLLGETLRVTNLGELHTGSLVNLERALRADQRLGGHFVQGHIDTTACVERFEPAGDDYLLRVELPARFAKYVIAKGSIAIDGISLTVASLDDSAGNFSCFIIPHTWQETNLKTMEAGRRVNLEFDLLAKYVERMVQV